VVRRVAGAADTEQEENHDQVEDVSLQAHVDEEAEDAAVQEIQDEPIVSPFAKLELQRFSKDYFRSLLTAATPQPQVAEISESARQTAMAELSRHEERQQRIVEAPDLRVPVGDNYVHLAQ
jgi:hypothetical protein